MEKNKAEEYLKECAKINDFDKWEVLLEDAQEALKLQREQILTELKEEMEKFFVGSHPVRQAYKNEALSIIESLKDKGE
jgi:tRNA G37 N-methylase Trm5